MRQLGAGNSPPMALEARCAEQDSGLKLNLHPRAHASINTLPPPVERPTADLPGRRAVGGRNRDAPRALSVLLDILLGPRRVLRNGDNRAHRHYRAAAVRFYDLG